MAATGDRQGAEDLVAEAFTRAWVSWRKVSRHPAPQAGRSRRAGGDQGRLGLLLRASPGHLERVFSFDKEDEDIVLVITPSGIPKGAVVSIGYKDPETNGPVQFGLAWKNRMTCPHL